MRNLTKLSLVIAAALAPSFAGVGAPLHEAAANPAVRVQAAGPTITITNFIYDPADLAATAGQAITVTNNDDYPHTVTAKDGAFNVDVPAKGTATLTAPGPGSFPYHCTLHPTQHNPASITVS